MKKHCPHCGHEYREVRLLAPSGTLYRVTNMRTFAVLYDLNRHKLSALVHGKKKVYQGWRVAV